MNRAGCSDLNIIESRAEKYVGKKARKLVPIMELLGYRESGIIIFIIYYLYKVFLE